MKSVDRVARSLVWLGRLAKGWSPQALGTGATGFSIIWGAYGSEIWGSGLWALVVAIAFALSSFLAQLLLQQPSYMEVARREENARTDSANKSEAIASALTTLLRKIAEHCAVAGNNDRVSVYYFHSERFVMLARWSPHPKYVRPGRSEYPSGQGAIGEAWDRGSAVVTLPASRTRWDQRLERHHGFAAGTARNLSMQCQSIAALRVETDHRAVGVIVFESTDPTRATQRTLDAASASLLYETLCELVGVAASMTPQMEQLTRSETPAPRAHEWKPTRA